MRCGQAGSTRDYFRTNIISAIVAWNIFTSFRMSNRSASGLEPWAWDVGPGGLGIAAASWQRWRCRQWSQPLILTVDGFKQCPLFNFSLSFSSVGMSKKNISSVRWQRFGILAKVYVFLYQNVKYSWANSFLQASLTHFALLQCYPLVKPKQFVRLLEGKSKQCWVFSSLKCELRTNLAMQTNLETIPRFSDTTDFGEAEIFFSCFMM